MLGLRVPALSRLLVSACLGTMGLLAGLLPTTGWSQIRVSAQAGVALPIGNFSQTQAFRDLLGAGPVLLGHADFPLGRQINLRITSGLWQNPLQQDEADYYLRQVPIGLGLETAFFRSRAIQPFVAIQPTLFITSSNLPQTSTRGYFGGMGTLGVRYKLKSNWEVNLSGTYVIQATRGSAPNVLNIQYLPISVGVGYTIPRPE